MRRVVTARAAARSLKQETYFAYSFVRPRFAYLIPKRRQHFDIRTREPFNCIPVRAMPSRDVRTRAEMCQLAAPASMNELAVSPD